MSLVVPVEFLPVKQNGQFCADGGRDFEFAAMTGAIQMMGVPPMPGAVIQSSFGGLSAPFHIPVPQRTGQSSDEVGLSKTNVRHSVRTIQTNSTSTSKYVSLPYQDHNYVQLPPSTPPLSPLSSLGVPTATVPKSNLLIDDISYHTTVATSDDSVTRCICEFQHDDGYMIQCDKCGVWQHVDCMEVDRNNIPESYMCELCEPRKVDKHKAIQIQTNKRDALSLLRVDSSATETEDETTDGRRRSFDKSPVKKEPKEVGGSTNIGMLSLNKKRRSRSKRDERFKRKLQIKRQNNGQQKLSVSSPKKAHFDPAMTDSFGETFRQDSTLSQNGALVMPVSSLNSNPAPGEGYQEAISNQYTVELQNLLASIKFNGQQGPTCSPSVYERLQFRPPCCLPAVVNGTRMCLEACEDLLTNQPLIEYVGKVMLRDQYDRDSLFYYRSEPNVLFYSKLGGLDLCIDASVYGNIARYVRRSCTPNAEVRHMLEGRTVRFFLCATKSIVCGAEITIPFDFNYHKCCYAVDCACTRISCPVAKFQRREASHPSGPTGRRQRSARSLDVAPVTQENPLSPRKIPTTSFFPTPLTSSVLGVTKHGRMSSLDSFKTDPLTETVVTKTEIKSEPDPVKVEPLSPTWPSFTAPIPAVTQETLVPASAPPSVTAVSSSAANASDADESDKSKKKTREEKKMEAYMKMFERLEKQQERKKEAQTRLEQGKGKDLTKTRESRKSKEKSENKNIAEATFDAKQSSADVSSNFNEQVVTTLPETTVKLEPKPRIKRSKHSAASRRASMSAVAHTVTNFTHPPVALHGSSDGHEFTASVTGDSTDYSVSSVYLSNPSALETATSLLALSAERWTGLPKKLMMKGQDLHKQLTIKTDGLETSSNSEGDSGREFVQCVPSPHSCSLNALRRNSMPAFGNSSGTACASNKAALLASASAVNGTDSKGCSAKKRWLQQAMCDKTELQPIGEEAASSIGQIANNSISPTDFVTPLKKRRLARESLSTESPPLAIQHDDSTSTSTMFPLYESISDDEHVDVEATPSSAQDVTNESKPNRVGMWEASLVANQTDIIVAQKTEKSLLESGLLRTQVSTPVNARPAMIIPEAYLLMPVGFQCPTGDNQSIRSAVPTVGGVTSMPNGFGAGVELGGAQAWPKTIPDLMTSGASSGLVVANPYHTTGYLSNLVPGGQKPDPLNAAGLVDYRLAFGSVDSSYNGSRNSSGSQMAPLTVGLNSNAGIVNTVYLTKPIAGPASEMSPVGGGYPMSLFHTMNAQSCDVQGMMALAEAACRSREKAAEIKTPPGDQAQVSPCSRSDENSKYNREMSSNLAYSFPLVNSDQHAKHQGYFNMTQASFIGGLQDSGLQHALSTQGDAMVAPNPSDLANGTSVSHSATLENGASMMTLWRGASVCNGSNGSAVQCNATGYTIDIPGVNISVAASPALSSPTSTAGQCTSKKKVSLHEYKMRRKSGGTGQSRLSSGSGSAADSDASLSLSFDTAVSPLSRSTSNNVSPDGSRELSEGLSLAWSSDATEAEKALENLTSSEKLLKVDKGNASDVGPLLPSGKLLSNNTSNPSETFTVQSTSAPFASTYAAGVLPSNVVLQPFESHSNRLHVGAYGDAAPSDRSLVAGASVVPVSSTTPASTGVSHTTANAQNVQTSNFGSGSSGSSLIQC